MSHTKNIRLGISIGDINGVGPEVIMKTFSDARILDFCTPIIFAPSKVIAFYRKSLQLKNFHFSVCDQLSGVKNKHVNIVSASHKEVPMNTGVSTKEGGSIALESLQAATEALKSGNVDVLVTAPINKDNIQSEEFTFPGHTEYLKDCFDSKESLMLMVNDELKIAVATGHIPLSEVSKNISKELIISKAKALNHSLKQDFTIRKPKIAILALNPHAGDNGLIGNEENDYINETIDTLQEQGVLAFGPFPADGFFGTNLYNKYDAVLAMYHDQGLVPFKTLSFGNGVNFTAALPFVRTSPDHGTAYEIAGKNQADESSFRKAVYQAIDIYRARTENLDLEDNKIDSKEVGQFLNQRRQAFKNKPNSKRTVNKAPRNASDSKPEERKRPGKTTEVKAGTETKTDTKPNSKSVVESNSKEQKKKNTPVPSANFIHEKTPKVAEKSTPISDSTPEENSNKPKVQNNLNAIFQSLASNKQAKKNEDTTGNSDEKSEDKES